MSHVIVVNTEKLLFRLCVLETRRSPSSVFVDFTVYFWIEVAPREITIEGYRSITLRRQRLLKPCLDCSFHTDNHDIAISMYKSPVRVW